MALSSIPSLQVIQAVSGTFHHFDLARELESRGYLKRIFSSYPWGRLRREGVSRERVRTFPWIHTPWMVAGRYVTIPPRLSREITLTNVRLFDAWVAGRLEDCDAFVAISGSGLKAGRLAQSRGAKYVCDRGSSHIRYQKTIVEEEYTRWGFPGARVDSRVLEREEMEYASSDAITVPSEFARRSFVEMGVDVGRVWTMPLGVRLDRFAGTSDRPTDTFNVLFAGTVSIRKGIPYLLEAFAKLKYPLKSLRLAGPVEPEVRSLLRRFDLTGVEVLGRLPQDEMARWMKASHALVLPSVEDGFGLVMAQAMACGAVVVASENTGGPDLFTDGVEGFVISIRSPEAICERLTRLADDPGLRQQMSEASLKRVRHLGGWSAYGSRYSEFLKELTDRG